MSPRLSWFVPVLVATLAFASATRGWLAAFALLLLAALPALLGPRLSLDLGRQLVVHAIGAGLGYFITALLHDPDPGTLSQGWSRLSAAALLVAAARRLLVDARGGNQVGVGLVFASLIASGKSEDPAYPWFACAFLLASLWVFAANGSRRRARGNWRRLAMGGVILATAGAFGLSATLGLRAWVSWLKSRSHSTAYSWRPQVGFSDRLDLGALDGLLDSGELVLRVRGARVDYLRGAALDLYEAGRWVRSDHADRERPAIYDGELARAGRVEITALGKRTARFFLPLAAAELVTTPSAVLVDGLGAVKSPTKHGLPVAHFQVGKRERAAVAPPRLDDLQVPRGLRPWLEALVYQWTSGLQTPAQKLGAIERHLLEDYAYARSFERPVGRDPVLDFLFRERRGHCEYFASALALGARMVGIPARVITGYRVSERSPFGYYVVRERNAHAWVEAWLPGQGWTTRDATPSDALPQNQQHTASYLASSLDALSVAYDTATERLERLTLLQTTALWLVGFVVLGAIVARGVRRRSAERRQERPEAAALPCLESLLATLERAGHERKPHEPIERLAARVPDAEAARLLERYTAFRYGGHGDGAELASAIATYSQGRRRRG